MKQSYSKLKLAGAGALLAFALAGCTSTTPTPASPPASGEITTDTTMESGTSEMTAISKAVAVIHPTKDNKVQGAITFTQEADGLHIKGNISGLTPGDHGFHAHESGDCSADGSSAGGHFNPGDSPHGAQDAEKRHAGDFGNIVADESGTAHIDKVDNLATLNGPNSIVGRAIIVHGNADDLTSQPSGDAGPRVACGVVGVAK